jgi:hypothetical protein
MWRGAGKWERFRSSQPGAVQPPVSSLPRWDHPQSLTRGLPHWQCWLWCFHDKPDNELRLSAGICKHWEDSCGTEGESGTERGPGACLRLHSIESSQLSSLQAAHDLQLPLYVHLWDMGSAAARPWKGSQAQPHPGLQSTGQQTQPTRDGPQTCGRRSLITPLTALPPAVYRRFSFWPGAPLGQ